MSSVEFTQPSGVSLVEGDLILLKRGEHDVCIAENEHGQKGLGHTPAREQWAPFRRQVPGRGACVAILVLIGCPKCGGIIFVPHTPNAADLLSRMTGVRTNVTHTINENGIVWPGVRCAHNCGFERGPNKIRLDEWHRVRRLYSAQIRRRGSLKLETVYTHASNQAEARMHLGLKHNEVLEAGPAPAIGWLGDEETGKVFGG